MDMFVGPAGPQTASDEGRKDSCLATEVRRTVVGEEGCKDHCRWSANGGVSDNRTDKDPMVLLSRVIMVPSLLSQRSHCGTYGSDHNRNLIVLYGCKTIYILRRHVYTYIMLVGDHAVFLNMFAGWLPYNISNAIVRRQPPDVFPHSRELRGAGLPAMLRNACMVHLLAVKSIDKQFLCVGPLTFLLFWISRKQAVGRIKEEVRVREVLQNSAQCKAGIDIAKAETLDWNWTLNCGGNGGKPDQDPMVPSSRKLSKSLNLSGSYGFLRSSRVK
ncbi:hypothetical protein M5K25_021416 [Dendrobium thyrsiflorum]|uniref:Uncharacterized protein n=1 Tax=Dendrobium thyrsiflorum TaxID=117978 RepID=A0ABD0UJA0_DENTH